MWTRGVLVPLTLHPKHCWVFSLFAPDMSHRRGFFVTQCTFLAPARRPVSTGLGLGLGLGLG